MNLGIDVVQEGGEDFVGATNAVSKSTRVILIEQYLRVGAECIRASRAWPSRAWLSRAWPSQAGPCMGRAWAQLRKDCDLHEEPP